MSISIIHPSRSRPKQAINTAYKWLDNAGCDCEYFLSLDEDDPQLSAYYTAAFPRITAIVVNKNRSAIDAINNAAKVATGNILIQIADDFDCPPLWGKQILDATQGKTDWIMKTPDGIQNWIITLPIMDRAYYERFGYIYHPDFRHMFCDTFMTCVADLTGRKIKANIPFKHNHYSIGGNTKDSVNDRADATWSQGEETFLMFAQQNYLLKPEEIKGKIEDIGYLNWIKNKI